MNSREAATLARRAGMMKCLPGDKFVSPLGQVYYQEPGIILPGAHAYAFMVGEQPVGVVIWRQGQQAQLRYCDLEGRMHHQYIAGDSFELQLVAVIQRMSELKRQYMAASRHPLARRAVANRVPA